MVTYFDQSDSGQQQQVNMHYHVYTLSLLFKTRQQHQNVCEQQCYAPSNNERKGI